MKLSWDDLHTILMVVRLGTLAAAANALDLNYTSVARRLKRAETALGQRLFERTPEGYLPTDAGRLIAAEAEQMEDAAHGMLRKLQGAETEIAGDLTITAPQLLIAHFLAPALDEFTRAYPQVNLRILATNDLLDLSRRQADLAIRISHTPGDTLTGLRLSQQHSASFATPEIANALAADPMQPVNWLLHDSQASWPKHVSPRFPNHRIHMRFDDMVAMAGAAMAGLGVVRMPMFLGRASPGLVQVPVLAPQAYADIWVVGHPDVWPAPNLQAFRNVLVRYFRANKSCFTAP